MRKCWENFEKISIFFGQSSLEVSEYFEKNRRSLHVEKGTCNGRKSVKGFEKNLPKILEDFEENW